MSEYQYYEFITLERRLTEREMKELRSLSTRALISPTRFTNVYHFGSFKGEPKEMMQRYFDAFVYVANWGTHQLMLRIPKGTLAPEEIEHYCQGDSLSLHQGEALVLDFINQPEDDWDDDDGEGWMPSLSQLRGELLGGDLRALYLGWLGGIHEYDVDELEPPVPPGLKELSAPLLSLAEFLGIEDELLDVAAEASDDIVSDKQGIEWWVSQLPTKEKDRLLISAIERTEPLLGAKLLRRYRASLPRDTTKRQRRAVSELLGIATRRDEENTRREELRQTAEKLAREAKQAAERDRHLAELAPRQEELWQRIEALVQMKVSRAYDEAISMLLNLCELSVKNNTYREFQGRVSSLREKHASKRTFLTRLDASNL